MSLNYDFGVTGIRADRTFLPREVLWTKRGARYLPGGRVLDGSKSRDLTNSGDADVLQPGLLVGRITSGGKYANSILGGLAAAASASATSLNVGVALAGEIVRRIGSSGTFKLTGPPTAAGTVATITVTFSAVDSTAGTVACSAISAAMVIGALVQPVDGSEVIRGVLDEFVKVTDGDGHNVDARAEKVLAGGFLVASSVVNWPTDTSLIAWVKGQLNSPASAGGPFSFDDNF